MTTYSEWDIECTRLKKALALARRRKTNCRGALAEKIELVRKVRQAEEALRQHKLNYFGYSRPEL